MNRYQPCVNGIMQICRMSEEEMYVACPMIVLKSHNLESFNHKYPSDLMDIDAGSANAVLMIPPWGDLMLMLSG